MPDELDELDDFDDVADRAADFIERQGLSELAYPQVLEDSIAHALLTPATPADPRWRFIGPRNVGGRVIALAQNPVNPLIVYAGTAHGGLWRSIDGGDTWERLGEPEHVFPVGAIALHPTRPRVLFVGTGSLDPAYVSGRGLFLVTIAGETGKATFRRLAGVDPPTVYPAKASDGAAYRYTRIRVDPEEPTRFWAASQTGLWRCELAAAAAAAPRFRRDFPDADNQPTVAKLQDSGAFTRWPGYATDVLVARDPRESATVVRGGREVARYLLLFVAVDGVGIFRGQFDRREGETKFESSPRDLPLGALAGVFNRIRLAQCERHPEHVYAVMARNADDQASEVFHSDDYGGSWKKSPNRIPPEGARGQASYDLVLEVAPDDPSLVVCGEIDFFLSTDSATTWKRILRWTNYDAGDKAQHADQHIAMFDAGDRRRLWVGNDGGLSLARNLDLPPFSPGYWRKRSHGIQAGQFQDVTTCPTRPHMFGGGLQDNGTYLSYGGATWFHIGGADGGMMAIDHVNPRQIYATTQGNSGGGPGNGGVRRTGVVLADQPPNPLDRTSVAATDLPDSLAPGHRVKYRATRIAQPANGIPVASPSLFVGILEQHPATSGTLMTGRRGNAFGTTNAGANWAPLGGAVALAANEKAGALCFGPVDATAAVPGVEGWVGTSAGNLFHAASAPGGPWTAPTALPWPVAGAAGAQPISRIAVHPFDRRIVAVSTMGTPGRVFLSYDSGSRWIDVTEPVPTALAVTPAGANLDIGEVRQFRASATYGAPPAVDVTTRAAWSSSNPAQASVTRKIGEEGQVTGVAAGSPTITATLLAGVATATANQAVTVAAAPGNPPAPPGPPARSSLVPALPPCPLSSVLFDPQPAAGAPMRLLAGTLAGVYVLPAIPAIVSLAITPAAATLQTGGNTVQLRCTATLSDATLLDVTRHVDWSTSSAAGAAVSNTAPNQGLVTSGGAVGGVTITANRGPRLSATLVVQVQAAAAPPPPPLPAFAGPATPPVPVAWRPFNQELPLVLVNDLDPVAGSNRIRIATFGLGCFECDTGAPVPHRLYIRQTLIEDGTLGTRALPPPITHDPRLPAGRVALDHTHAFDIRLDAPPYSFFDDLVDGAEFDELLGVDDPIPTEENFVYVQVQNSGTQAIDNARLHLYVAECDPIPPLGAVASAVPATLDAAAPVTDFYGLADRNPPAASRWKRIGALRTLPRVAPGTPVVTRFTWTPDAALAGKHAALLALCEGPDAAHDPLPAAPAGGGAPSALIQNERRAALRIVQVAARPPARLFLRDGIADATRVGGYPVGGRSPDILVRHPDITRPAADEFADLLAQHPNDTIQGSVANVVYVRVHNDSRFPARARVALFAVRLDASGRPDTTLANWIQLPAGAPPVEVDVPARDVAYARIDWASPIADPAASAVDKAYLLVALIEDAAATSTDRLPDRNAVADADTFWQLVTRFVDSDNAAARAVRWIA